MLRKFIETFKVKLRKDYEHEFHNRLVIENSERIFIVSILGLLFFFTLLYLDFQRITAGQFNTNFFYQISMFLHMCLAFLVIPAFLIHSNSNKISTGEYKYSTHVVYGTMFWIAAILVPMSLFATVDRRSLMTFVLFMIIVNLFLTLKRSITVWINIISIVVLSCGVYLIQKSSPILLTASLIEAYGISIPVILIGLYQYNLRIIQFLNEKKVEEQNILLQKSMEEEFNQQIAEIEMRALRAQMNPHFLFNVLNSIKLYMVQNDAKTASNYLTKFSRLIRLVLNNSKAHMVKLTDELEALRLYIEMENFRFNDKFDYKINVGKEIDSEMIELPPLILQPYVENAIWHGLMHKSEGRGLLRINIGQNGDESIQFIIEDNGIGRDEAKKLKTNSARKNKHKSVGMQITQDRISMTNQYYGTNASVDIFDLKDDKGRGVGTKVVVHLPISEN